MVDVSEKAETKRVARARGQVAMARETLRLAVDGQARKATSSASRASPESWRRRRRSELIPLCHPLTCRASRSNHARRCAARPARVARSSVTGKTGVEMEALTAVSVACLTIYDMLKAVDRGMRIEGVDSSKSAAANPAIGAATQSQGKDASESRPTLNRALLGTSCKHGDWRVSVDDASARSASLARARTFLSARRMAACWPQDLIAWRTQPPFPISAMDGYAVRAADLAAPGAH